MMAEVRVLVSRQPHIFDRVMPSHIRILECVKGQDPAGARAAMREHLETAVAIQRDLIRDQAAVREHLDTAELDITPAAELHT